MSNQKLHRGSADFQSASTAESSCSPREANFIRSDDDSRLHHRRCYRIGDDTGINPVLHNVHGTRVCATSTSESDPASSRATDPNTDALSTPIALSSGS